MHSLKTLRMRCASARSRIHNFSLKVSTTVFFIFFSTYYTIDNAHVPKHVTFFQELKMSDSEDSVISEDSPFQLATEFNGKPIDAFAEVCLTLDTRSKNNVEKVFGLRVKSTNAMLKFKLVVDAERSFFIPFKLQYLSEDLIDCQIKLDHNKKVEVLENVIIGDEVINSTLTEEFSVEGVG